jgi:signal transduction histidine kinase
MQLMRTARSFAYLVTSLLAGPVCLLWTLATTAATAVGAVTALGAPVFLAVTWLDRRLATAERHRARLVLGSPIGSPYLPATGSGWARVRQVAAQPATWRDMAWFVLLFPLGLSLGIVAVVTAAVTAGALTAPAWAWSVPERRAPVVGQHLMGTPSGRILLAVAGLALAPVVLWLLRRLARLQVTVAVALLAPGEHSRLVQRTEELAATRARVVDAQAAELRRIERDLHDGAQARIVAAGMTLALAERRARTGVVILDDVATARRQLDDALAELRRLVRGIHPPILTDRGLSAALSALAADCGVPVDVAVDLPERLTPAVESAAYFVVAEGLANAVKHGDGSGCAVTVTRSGGLTVTVSDDGPGGADPTGSGLDGLRRRVEALDGTFSVTSPPGGPTRLTAEFPCAS